MNNWIALLQEFKSKNTAIALVTVSKITALCLDSQTKHIRLIGSKTKKTVTM
ncbi:hypothetical protein [Flavobacterium sp.]|uniref:hypothetical protein n=1 Tax=Flavobacterium sp. TaxID=239 RepID=UPI00286DD109|nr:hypothetical protein [Flavobacterium sp.]